MSSINLQASPLSGCETHIAIVVDESGSINTTEAQQIKDGLTSFINSQAQSNITLSLIGMSHSDSATRPDNILQKRIADHKTAFLTWTNLFGSGRADKQSDYWASGLQAVKNLSVIPDIIVVVTDGLQSNNSDALKELYTELNWNSQLFVYGVTSTENNINELITPLTSFLGKAPVLKTNGSSILKSDYIRVPDFSTLGNELNQLTADLAAEQIGCISNVSIIQNKLVYPTLKKGLAINQEIGTLVLKNKSRVALTLNAGTKIHDVSNLSGLVFKLQDTITIAGSSQVEAIIRVEGTPLATGNFNAPIALNKVKNLAGYRINFTVTKELYVVGTTTGAKALQSTSLQIAAAGSKGIDSTKGIHLRWMLAGKLGDNHLPKGNLFTGERSNFNKPNDFVKLYRAPYTKVVTTIDFTTPPQVVDAEKALWIYKTNKGGLFYVYFRNKEAYNSIQHNPLINPAWFIGQYSGHLLEIENKSELFFAATLNLSSVNSNSNLQLETLSVSENTMAATKRITNRKTFSSDQLNNVRVVAENGRSIRLKSLRCQLSSIHFELYSDFISNANTNGLWDYKGQYALSDNNTKVFEQLEPKLNAVHGKWLKYNDDEYVNIANYKDRWDKPVTTQEKSIKSIVNQYITLSQNPNNPTAKEPVSLGNPIPINEPKPGEEQLYDKNETEISNLDMLNIAANDYHIARMLGLGCLDIDDEVLSGEFIYLTEYTTFGNLEGGTAEKEVLHLSMSIPTSVNTERLPIPVQLSKLVPGLNNNSEEGQSAKITNPDGYSLDGKKRYLSLFMDDVMDYEIDTETNINPSYNFFKSAQEYDGSSFTFPIYLGVDYKIGSAANWEKQELSVDTAYYNIGKDLKPSNYEPTPIIIPEPGKSIMNVRQEKTGTNTYYYQGYGINIFSRASSGRQISVESNIKPANTLMPPTSINSHLITKENPLMFTSQTEQTRYNAITAADKTLVRILFDYYSIQEMENYPVPDGMTPENAVKPDPVNPDEETFADNFKIYYKDGLPAVEHAEIKAIDDVAADNLTAIITIGDYKMLSSGEEVKLTLNNTNKTRFIGGILTIDDQNYVIKGIDVFFKKNDKDQDVFNYALVEVLKKEVAESIQSNGDATIDSEQIKPIKKPVNGLCTLVQNMLTLSNWHRSLPLDFRVECPAIVGKVNKEIVQYLDKEGNGELQIEKTRGIWENAVISRELENTFKMKSNGSFELDAEGNTIPLIIKDAYEMNSDGSFKLDTDGKRIPLQDQKHLGLYKIVFSNYTLAQHPQFKAGNENSVEWFNGTIRLFTKSAVRAGSTIPVKTRKEFKVVRTENSGGTGNLVLYINDTNFKLGDYVNQTIAENYDEILLGEQKVNYYPSYRVYLYANPANGITAANILPRENESTHYSIFGISTHSNHFDYDSKISVPSPMYSVKVTEPARPEEVKGSLYATRPDFYNRSTYTFTTKYKHKPYGVLHYRANDEDLLNVLYKKETINNIREALKKLGGNNEVNFGNRWENFLNFDMLQSKTNYEFYPTTALPENQYRFPLPDHQQLIEAINEFVKWHNKAQGKTVPEITAITALNQVIISTQQGIEQNLLAIHFIEQAIHTAFVPLTEVPVVYEHIKGNNYVPIGKKQTIKDKNGYILKPTDPDFDIAPMMKIADPANNITQFTDFNLDGNSQNIYFYAVREMDIKMNFSQLSKVLGPVKLVASNPPQTPEIKRIMPIPENKVLGIKPSVQIELNAYETEYNIKKINIYRAASLQLAQSIRTMTPVKEILITKDTLSNHFDNVWTVYDDFSDQEFVPFAEGLFYRITVSREIEYEDASSTLLNPILNIDYAPSQPSKITATIIADSVSPQSPVLEATGVVTGTNGAILKPVVFSWNKTTHNGKYHLYKMNNQGNWEKHHEIVSNDKKITLPLLQTKPATDELLIKNEEGERIYHHFKVIAENSSGMFSSEEKILTL
ncbi:VWA domain-containing protein [Flavobacterium poyangense]|uniref:VWA domain-containing protein n=1 Tax=Flavobacterium poyangense TaxID=2204302 RepID=UPI001421618D|nr:VWA domain-containing protein [Flavobacterium sp. JXAS1]